MSKEELSFEIEKMREYLNYSIERRTDYSEILENSRKLDFLIISYMEAGY